MLVQIWSVIAFLFLATTIICSAIFVAKGWPKVSSKYEEIMAELRKIADR